MNKKPPYRETLSFLIYRAYIQGLAQQRRALQKEGFDVTPEQLSVMVRLRECEGTNQRQLGEKTFKDRPNMTRIVRLLVQKGLIERRADEKNRKANLLFLTDAGREILERIAPIVLRTWKSRYAGLSPEEIESFRKILKRIVENIERQL